MRSRSDALLLCAALVAVAPASTLTAEDNVVETKRVVVRVDVDPGDQSYDYVFVDHEDGEPIVLDAVLADRGYLGVALLDLTAELRRHFGLPGETGVMISRVEPKSPASRAGLRVGDILMAIDGEAVGSPAMVVQRVSEGEGGQTLALDVRRDGEPRSITATLTTRQRKQLDLGGLIMVPGHAGRFGRLELEHDEIPMVELDPESMGRALTLMRQHFDSTEWRQQLERFDGDRESLEERLRELEQRLRELERQLRELPE